MKKLIILLAAILAILLLTSGTAFAFSDGTGSSDNPYQIKTIQDLKDINTNLTASYLLMNNLEIDEGTWIALGRDNSAHRFTGVFDGNGFTITFTEDTEFKSDDNTGYGLFGAVTNDAELKNIQIAVNGNLTADPTGSQDRVGVLTGIAEGRSLITNCTVIINDGFSISANNMVGGLAGVLEVGTISSSHFIGTVEGSGNVGGLAGFVKDSVVYSNYMAGTVNGTGDPVGGLAGRLENSAVDSCYFSGSVEGSKNVGGLAGYVYGSTISDSYVLGTVTGAGSAGGLVGDLTHGAPSFIENCYSAAYVAGNTTGSDYVGGIIGAEGYSGAVQSCFYIAGNVFGGDNGVGISVAGLELMDILTFTSHPDLESSWSISSTPDSAYTWYINDGGYPQLFWQYEEPVEEPVNKGNSGGSGFGSATVVNPPKKSVNSGNNLSGGSISVLPEQSEGEGYESPVETASYNWQICLLLLMGCIILICSIWYIIVIKRRREEE